MMVGLFRSPFLKWAIDMYNFIIKLKATDIKSHNILSLSMSHRERGHCTRLKDQWKKRPAILEMFCVCSEYESCDYQQKSGECVQGGQTSKEESASDHAVADCSNPFFFLKFCFCVLLATSANPQYSHLGTLQTRRASQFITRWTLFTSYKRERRTKTKTDERQRKREREM